MDNVFIAALYQMLCQFKYGSFIVNIHRRGPYPSGNSVEEDNRDTSIYD